MYLSKSMKVLASKCTLSTKSKRTKCLKIADLQAHNASWREALCACRSAIFKHFVLLLLVLKVHFDGNTAVFLLWYILN